MAGMSEQRADWQQGSSDTRDAQLKIASDFIRDVLEALGFDRNEMHVGEYVNLETVRLQVVGQLEDLKQQLAEQQVERLTAHIELLRAESDARHVRIVEEKQRADALRQQLAEAQQALKDYGQHKRTCATQQPKYIVYQSNPTMSCDCGFAVLAVDQEPPQKGSV
jgi:chromosome segregation ATPase